MKIVAINPLSPIPQNKIGEDFGWRDWFKNVYNSITYSNNALNSGVSGTFKSADTPPKTITVTNGIITSIV